MKAYPPVHRTFRHSSTCSPCKRLARTNNPFSCARDRPTRTIQNLLASTGKPSYDRLSRSHTPRQLGGVPSEPSSIKSLINRTLQSASATLAPEACRLRTVCCQLGQLP